MKTFKPISTAPFFKTYTTYSGTYARVPNLLHELQRRDAKRGLATLCVSGGMGIATTFHRV